MPLSALSPRRPLRLAALLALGLVAAFAPASASAARLDLSMGEEMVGGASPVTNPPVDQYFTTPRWKFDSDANENAVLDAIKASGASISYNLRYQRDFGPVPAQYAATNKPDALSSVKKIKARGIPWKAWITIPYADGYWATEANRTKVREAVVAFDAWANANNVKPTTVSIDLESTPADTAKFGNIANDPIAAAQMFVGNLNPANQCAAARYYRDQVVGWLKASPRSYSVIASIYPYALDDMQNGDLALSDALNMPVAFRDVFDELAFMTMRSAYAEGGLGDPGSTMMTSYGADARANYGNRAKLIVGVPGYGPYKNSTGQSNGRTAMLFDLRTAALATTGTVSLYSAETMYRHLGAPGGQSVTQAGGVAAIKAAIAAADNPLTGLDALSVALPSPNTLLTRGLIQATDLAMSTLTFPSTLQFPNRWPAPC